MELIGLVLLCLVYPAWLLSGVGDWWTHRRSRIEHTAGVPEAALHLVMLGQLALGNTAVLLLEVNAAVLAIVAALVVAHEATMWIDLRWSHPRREIGIVEQWCHAWQIVLPWATLVALVLMHADDLGTRLGDWRLRWKDPPLPPGVIAAVIGAGVVAGALPFLEEFARCWRARKT